MSAIPQTIWAQVQPPGTYDVCPGVGVCDYESPDDAVNDLARVDGDIIEITTNTYVLTSTLQVDNDITINGNGSIIDADGLRGVEVAGLNTVSINDLTISNANDPGEAPGGAISITGGGTLTLTGLTVETSSASGGGGGLYNFDSTVEIFDSAFLRNDSGGAGGAINTRGPNAVTNLTRVTIDGNTAFSRGGGLTAELGATINVFESTVSRNAALAPVQTVSNPNLGVSQTNCGAGPGPVGQSFIADAAALSSFEVTVQMFGSGTSSIPNDINIPGQVRQGDGQFAPIIATASAFAPGGVWTAGSNHTLTFILDQPLALIPGDTYSIEFFISGNYAYWNSPDNTYLDGGLIGRCSGGYGFSNTADLAFSTFGGTPKDGGGIYSAGTVNLQNSTVSGNVGDGAFASAGNYVVGAEFSTIANNSGNGLTAEAGNPGGVIAFGGSILAGNGGSDCFRDDLGALSVSVDFNLIGDISGCDFFVPQTNDLTGGGATPVIDPLLGPLQDNGGLTFTHALDANSPAVDAGGACNLSNNPLLNDQRGTSRPQAGACDIGAYELAPTLGPLQTLIDAAAPGATINVPDGSYAEPITIGDGKTLIGSGPGNVTIDATNLNSTAITATGDFGLIGLSVIGGNSAGHGGGIFADIDGTDISLNNVFFNNNNAVLDGGAIYLRNGSLTGTSTTFTANAAGGNGGAIFSGTNADISDSFFGSNQAGGNGGAIANTGVLTSTGTGFSSNNANNGGAISIEGGALASTSLNGNIFQTNTATRDGGAIYESFSNLSVVNGFFLENTAGDSNGGFAGDGGAIYTGSNTEISASTFNGNSAVEGDGVPGDGGSIFYEGALTLVDSTIENASAGIGGGIYGTNNAVATISGTTFNNNDADGSGTAGGAIGGSGTLEITNSTLSGNTTSGNGNGAGIGLLAGSASLNNVTLAFNASTGLGGPFYAEGGALITFTNSLVSGNTGNGTNCNTVLSLGYNVFQNAPCPTLASDIVSDPQIGLLASNGGPTQTHALDATSPARDAADPGQLAIELSSALNAAQLTFNGAATQFEGVLIPVSGVFVAGSIFATAPDEGPFDLDGSFSTTFSFQITDPVAWAGAPSEPSGDGFTFAVAANPTVLGEPGGRLGVATSPGPLGTVSVEFDTFPNGGDFGTNSIGINVGGIGNGQSVISAVQAAIPGGFDDGTTWTAWIEYQADTNRLDVRVAADGVRPELPQLSHTVDIAAEVGPTGYYGFTGGTGLANATHSITAWEFFETNCPSFDQRGNPRPEGAACDIGAFEGAAIPLELGSVTLNTITPDEELDNGFSYPGVTDVPIIDIPIEKLTGDVNNPPESAPLGSFPLGSFPIGSFDLRSSPIGSFPLGSFPIGSFPIGSFPIGSFPIGSFPLSSIPLLREGGWSRILEDIPELEGAPLQTVTLEQVLTSSSVPASVDEIELRDLAIEGSPLASLSLQGLSLGATTVEEIDQWAANAGSTNDVCAELATNEPAFTDCAADDTLLSLEFKGAPVSALSLQSLPLGSFPTTAAPLGSFPIGSFPLGSFPLGSFPLGSFPLGSFPLGSFPLGSFPIGSFPIGSFPLGSFELDGKSFCELYDEKALASAASTCSDLGVDPGTDSLADLVTALQTEAAITSDTTSGLASTPLGSFPLGSFPIGSFPIGSFPLGSFPIGSFPIGSFPIGSFPIGSFPLGSFPIGSFPLGSFNVDGQPFCEVYDRQAGFDGAETCGELLADPATASLADLINVLAATYGDIASTPLGSFPIGSFPIGSFPIGSFPLGSFDLNAPPLSDLSLGDFGGCELIASSSADDCTTLGLSDTSTLLQVADTYGSIEASPLGSFPLGSFGISDLPMGSFPIGSFEINGTPLGSFPLGSFELINSPIGSFPIGSFPLGSFPLGSFPLGSFDFVAFPIGSFPLGSFTVDGQPFCDVYDQKAAVDGAQTCGDLLADPANATLPDLIVALGANGATNIASTPLGSFPLGSFPLGSFPIGSFPADIVTDPSGLCDPCETLADAARAGVINPSATLANLEESSAFASVTLAEVMDAMTMASLYGDGTLEDIDDLGSLTLGQLLIAMMLKTDFPWETIPLEQLDAQTFSADNFVDYTVNIPLTGTEPETLSVAVTLDDGFLYVKGSSSLDVDTGQITLPTATLDDPTIVNNGDDTQTLNFSLVLGGFSVNTISFTAIPPLALGDYPATAVVTLGSDAPVDADASNGALTVISDPINDISDPNLAPTTPADILALGFISEPDDNDYYRVAPPKAGDRVAVFMSNPVGDNDLIMYEPLSTVEAKGQAAESAPLDSVPFEDDGVVYQGNISEEPNALEDVNLADAPLASISTNRGTLDESVSAIAGGTEPFTIQVSGYNGALSDQPYTLRVKVTPRVTSPQCTARIWPANLVSAIPTAGNWTANTNAVFFINYARLAASDPDGVTGADAALTAINNLVSAPGIVDGVVVDVSTIFGVDDGYLDWDANPCDVDAPNAIVNAITRYIEEQRVGSPLLTYVTIVGSDEVIPFARKPDETSIANESTFAGEFADNAMYGALLTRHFLSDDPYGDIDPIPWLDRYLNVPELAVGRLVESASDIETAANNYLAFGGVLSPQTALSAGYDFVADASEDIDVTFNEYGPVLGFSVEDALIDPAGILPKSDAWTRDDFLGATGVNPVNPGDPLIPVDLVSFNMHFDFDEALPSIGDALGNYSDNLINATDLAGSDLAGGIWFTVGCHSGTNVPDVSVVGAAPSEDWAQSFGRLGAVYLAQNAFGLGDTEALALTERLMANFAENLNGSLTIGQAHAFAKQQYFANLGLYGEYDFKAMQAATLFGLPMYQYGNGASVVTPPLPPLPVTPDPISGLNAATWSLASTSITRDQNTSKGDVFSVNGDVQFVHFRPLQPIVRRDVTSPDGEVAAGAFLTQLNTEDIAVDDIAFARPVIDLGENEPEIETDEVVFPTAFTNIANYKAPPPGGGPFEPRDQLNVIVGQFTSPLDGKTDGTERLFRSFDTQVFYRPAAPAAVAAPLSVASEDFRRPEFDNVQASVVGSGAPQAAFSVEVSDDSAVLRVAVLYLQSVSGGIGNWTLVDLVKGGGNTWTGGGPVDLSGITNDQIDYMVQAVDENGNVANSTFKGLFYVAKTIPGAPDGTGDDPFEVVLTDPVDGTPLSNDDWNPVDSIQVTITTGEEVSYQYSVDGSRPLLPLTPAGFIVEGDGIHIVQLFGSDGSQETFVLLIDNTPADIVIARPANGEFVVQGQAPAAEYVCWDSGSGAATCDGPVPSGDSTPENLTGTQTFLVNATDNTGLESSESNSYFVVQQLSIDGPAGPLPIGTTAGIIATATDLADMEEFMTIDWGDGTVSTSTSPTPDTVVQNGDQFTAEHLYAAPGVYTVTATVEYDGGAHVQTAVFEYVVIYDPQGGFVTGGGWFNSPSGAYTPNDDSDEDVTGKANFGFNSKYKKGQSIPSGSTTFRFAAGGLEFDATVYEWMIITGARARYKGEGTVEGMPGLYKFQVTALDADVAGSGFTEDGFRIKIWQEGSGVIYDNGRGVDDTTGNGGTTSLGGGQIKVHKAK